MESWGAVLITLCIFFFRQNAISGAHVELKIRQGDNVTVYCDCSLPIGSYIAWFKNCSHENQPPLIIHTMKLVQGENPHYDLVWDASAQSFGLLIKNITESDMGLYYCAIYKTTVTEECGLNSMNVYQFGNRTTLISLVADTTVPCANLSQTPSTPPVSDCSVCWKLLVSVCPVCVLLSSTCVCCIYRHTTTAKYKAGEEKCEKKRSQRREKVGEGDVCYASLDIQSGGWKHMRTKTRAESSELCTYSHVQYVDQN
ncbi:uncharacterized protein LOC108411570 [Pygocentrus nattereri]|uniref:uncharacterized protein LOC108411570 n=1 Tax=Pygocentrus nattereri TaxID=42514 RepID=UPI0018919E11|nr:uncharacterized protein LOC108411570 [Pygocentrus nattereri]